MSSPMSACKCKTVFEYGLLVLNTHSSESKAAWTLECKQLYDGGRIALGETATIGTPPLTPARPLNVQSLAPSQMAKRGKGGTLKNRVALIHSFCHIESYAIDLSWDVLLRYARCTKPKHGHQQTGTRACQLIDELVSALDSNDVQVLMRQNNNNHGVVLPTEFYEDWLRVAAEEALHFTLWANRLKELGSFYGELPGHDGLWKSAKTTHDDVLARLAIVHMVLEGRGLDVAPFSMKKLRNVKDEQSLELLKVIYEDEITHVASGLKWFTFVCRESGVQDPIKHFHHIVRERFDGKLKPPFNDSARLQAGMTTDWYAPLAT